MNFIFSYKTNRIDTNINKIKLKNNDSRKTSIRLNGHPRQIFQKECCTIANTPPTTDHREKARRWQRPIPLISLPRQRCFSFENEHLSLFKQVVDLVNQIDQKHK